MKTLIVYYSRTGMTKKVALKLAGELGMDVDIEELVDKNKRSGVVGYLMSGRDAMQKKLTTIEPLRYNPAEYDLVILGTPTWAYAMACAMRTYLTDHTGEIKQAAFFATNGSDGGDKAIKQMAELSGLKARAELVLTSKEASQDNYPEKLKEFISLLK
jgi:flavodoxin